jgi:hypothetical protein
MIAVLVQAKPWYDGPHFWEGFAAMGGFVITFLKWGWPPVRVRWMRWRNWVLVRDGKAAVTVNGVPVSPVILSIPVRLKNLDDGQLAILNEISAYKIEHGNQVTAIAASVDEIKTQVKDVGDMVLKTVKNGLTSNDTGDMIYRIGQKMGVVVNEGEAPQRREDDVT